MTRSVVRAQIAEWLMPEGLAEGPVAFLSAVQPHAPKVTTENTFELGKWDGTGLVMRIYLENQREKRIATGGPHNGRKWRTYDAVLMCFLRSAKPQAEDADADNDSFIDSLIERIEADRNLGTTGGAAPTIQIGTGQIFQAGEGSDMGGDDLIVETGLPVTINGGLTQIITLVHMTVVEIVNT